MKRTALFLSLLGHTYVVGLVPIWMGTRGDLTTLLLPLSKDKPSYRSGHEVIHSSAIQSVRSKRIIKTRVYISLPQLRLTINKAPALGNQDVVIFPFFHHIALPPLPTPHHHPPRP